MGSHPLNLAIRFLLELCALAAMGVWGWRISDGWLRFLLAVLLPVIAAAAWGTFAVPDDPSRSGGAPVPVSGIIRLGIEAAIFIVAVWALYDVGFTGLSWGLGIIVVIHYLASYDRILWLFNQ
ncbi:MAG: YrdB family protein [Caldilineaceae bacterium]